MVENVMFPSANLLGIRVRSTLGLVKKIQNGFSFKSFERLQRAMDIPTREMAELVQITPRTLTRRKASGKLEPDESERVLRAARVYVNAVELFEGDNETAKHWLTSKKIALNGRTPLEFAKSEVGAREVEKLIGQLEYGVFS